MRSKLITVRGQKALADELDKLWNKERPKITQEVADAAAHGDRSENAEYIYGKKKLREIDRRVRYLSKRLEEVTVVRPPAADLKEVRFGAWVSLEDEGGSRVEYQIVGFDEVDAKNNRISVDAPVAKALLGKNLGDEITVQRPKGEITYQILGVRYR